LVQRAGLHQVYTTLQGHPYPLGSNTELILFRIFQELINNIIKNASAGTIKVDFKYEPGQFTLQIADDGKGFDLSRLADAQNRDRGLGIKNMQNRAKMVQADFFMESTIGKGTKAVITVKN
jgi:signal transduction histidine kinase